VRPNLSYHMISVEEGNGSLVSGIHAINNDAVRINRGARRLGRQACVVDYRKLAASWGEQASWTQDSATHPGEAHALKLDASKAGACLGWLPVLPLKPALEWIVEWYRAFQNGDDLRRLTEAQIERYESLLQQLTTRRKRFGES